MHSLAIVLMFLIVIVFPSLCIARIAFKMGKSSLLFGLLAAMPMGVLIALGLLAWASGKEDPPAQ